MTVAVRIIFIAGTILTLAGKVPAGEVKVYLDETRKEYIFAQELDCKVYEGRNGITIGFKASSCFFNIGPEFTLGGTHSIQWDKTVHEVITRYKELCARFNAGAITMKEYKERLDRIDSISKEALEFQARMMKAVKEESREAFRDLDRETKDEEKMSDSEVGRKIGSIDSQLDKLP